MGRPRCARRLTCPKPRLYAKAVREARLLTKQYAKTVREARLLIKQADQVRVRVVLARYEDSDNDVFVRVSKAAMMRSLCHLRPDAICGGVYLAGVFTLDTHR